MINSMDVIIVEENLPARTQLLRALKMLKNFPRVAAVSTVDEAKHLVAMAERPHLIFLSFSIGQEKITEFIREAKQTKTGRHSTYILMLGDGQQNGVVVASNIVVGANGFLIKPYSVTSLYEITEVAQLNANGNRDHRRQMALTLLAKTVRDELDRVARARAKGGQACISPQIRSALASVKSLGDEHLADYYDILSQAFKVVDEPTEEFEDQEAADSTDVLISSYESSASSLASE